MRGAQSVEIFQYDYMIRAMVVGLILSIIIPIMGVVIVNRRTSMVGDALSHVSLAGVMGGLIMGINPVLGAILGCLIATFFMEFIRKKFPSYGEISTAIIMSFGVGMASLLSGFVTGPTNIESFLFGSIIAITDFEFIMIRIMAFIVIVNSLYFFKDLMYISFDPISAALSGVKVDFVGGIFLFLTAVTVAISSRTVGVLIISSLMVLPVSCGMQLGKGYRGTTILSVLFGIFFTEVGLIISYYGGLKPGGSIVLLGVITLLFIFFIQFIKGKKIGS